MGLSTGQFSAWQPASLRRSEQGRSCCGPAVTNLTRSMRMWVRSLVSLSELRIWHCHELQCRLQTRLRSCIAAAVAQAGSYSSNSTPSLGTSMCYRCSPKKKKTKQNKNEHNRFQDILRAVKGDDCPPDGQAHIQTRLFRRTAAKGKPC